MALSTADAEKWRPLKARHKWAPDDERRAENTSRARPRQRQVHLNAEQAARLVARYVEGATVYELAAKFGCHRNTASAHIKRAGVPMRRQAASFRPSPRIA